MCKIVFLLLTMLFASSVSAQTVVGSFKKDGQEISLLFDGRWGIVTETEVKCRAFPHIYSCIEDATKFSEEASLAPINFKLIGINFADAGVFVGRTFGENSSDTIEIARQFMNELSSGYNVPGERIRLLSTESGTIRSYQFYRYEFLTDMENGPLWSTVTRVKDGSRTADVGTHVFGEMWTTSPEMLAIRKDFHMRLIRNLPLGWVNE